MSPGVGLSKMILVVTPANDNKRPLSLWHRPHWPQTALSTCIQHSPVASVRATSSLIRAVSLGDTHLHHSPVLSVWVTSLSPNHVVSRYHPPMLSVGLSTSHHSPVLLIFMVKIDLNVKSWLPGVKPFILSNVARLDEGMIRILPVILVSCP